MCRGGGGEGLMVIFMGLFSDKDTIFAELSLSLFRNAYKPCRVIFIINTHSFHFCKIKTFVSLGVLGSDLENMSLDLFCKYYLIYL